MLKEKLDNRKDLQPMLFRRAWLVSKETLENKMECFPFYGNWKSADLGGVHIYVHDTLKIHYVETGRSKLFLCGHCYNPFTLEHEEEKCLKRIGESLGNADFWERVSEITGVFVLGWLDEKGNISVITDPSGMQSGYFGEINGNFLVTSHCQILGDLYGLEMNELTKELLDYKWYYRVMGPYLPGDMTQFDGVTRIVPNIVYSYNARSGKVSHSRFYPLSDNPQVKNDKEYHEVIEKAANILKHGADLVARKWNHPAVSLTGGIDSNTTFAACNGHYNEFATFSYLSAHKETIDVEAAKKIAARFKTRHRIFHIPETSEELTDFELKKDIISHNDGYIYRLYDNEMRKRIYLEKELPYDVEIKSWVSETIRAYWYKHYGRKSMPALSAKLFRNLYKIFITNRSLAHKIDKVFEAYIEKYDYRKISKDYLPADLHYNEVTWGSWGGPNISDMKFYTDITFLYNNRVFLDLLLRVPLEKRISDEHHLDMKKYLNKELYDMGIRVVNMKETRTRAFLLNVIFTLNTYLPF